MKRPFKWNYGGVRVTWDYAHSNCHGQLSIWPNFHFAATWRILLHKFWPLLHSFPYTSPKRCAMGPKMNRIKYIYTITGSVPQLLQPSDGQVGPTAHVSGGTGRLVLRVPPEGVAPVGQDRRHSQGDVWLGRTRHRETPCQKVCLWAHLHCRVEVRPHWGQDGPLGMLCR